MSQKLVIVGNGMVTGRFLDEIFSRDRNKYEITVVSAEEFGSYNRIMLSSVLSGEANIQSIIQKTPVWYKENNIKLHLGETVVSINKIKQCITTNKQQEIHYDHLVIATGSRSSKIPAGNLHLPHIYPFRSINDTQGLLERTKTAKKAIVVGGGFLGLEAAWGLAQSGVEVSLVHRSPWLLNRQLDQTSANMLLKTLESRGLKFYLANEVETFIGEESVNSALLKDGTQLECDMAVIATGITPNAEIGLHAGLSGQRAIAVDTQMCTSDQHISAIGECVEFEGNTFGLVDPLWRHAKVLAERLCRGICEEGFENSPIATKLKISGVNLYSAGHVSAPEGAKEIVVQDTQANIYRKLIVQHEKIIGIVLYGDVRSGAWYFDLMQEQKNIEAMLPNIIFGEAYAAA